MAEVNELWACGLKDWERNQWNCVIRGQNEVCDVTVNGSGEVTQAQCGEGGVSSYTCTSTSGPNCTLKGDDRPLYRLSLFGNQLERMKQQQLMAVVEAIRVNLESQASCACPSTQRIKLSASRSDLGLAGVIINATRDPSGAITSLHVQHGDTDGFPDTNEFRNKLLAGQERLSVSFPDNWMHLTGPDALKVFDIVRRIPLTR